MIPALRRSHHDREILRIAFPALGALAAEPLYVLVDTAIVGHLGTPQIAALGIAGAVLTGLYGLFNFLAYATTAHVARYEGGGQRAAADAVGTQALWLSLAIGAVLLVVTVVLAEPIVAVMGGEGQAAEYAVQYLQIAAIGLPCALVALAGQGYLRGVRDLRTPLVIVVAANVVNVILEVVFVYGFDWGIRGSAWGTAIAQLGMGAAFVWKLPLGRLAWTHVRRLLSTGGHIFVRTTSLVASFVFASAVVARSGNAALGAHQVVFQLWLFLSLALDALAIAGQVIVGRMLGAGDADGAFAAAARMIVLSTLAGVGIAALLFALGDLLPLVFTSDDAVLGRIDEIWPIFVLSQPLAAAVFALDGILIGAGDSRYVMWAMVVAAVVFTALLGAALELDWGLVGVWLSLVVLIAARAALMGARFGGRRWAVTGWT